MSEAPTQATDPNLFRRVMGQFATGVTVLSFMPVPDPLHTYTRPRPRARNH